jgi:hypothetical protein
MYAKAFGEGIHTLLTEGIEGNAITAVKVWQSGTHIFRKFLFDHVQAQVTRINHC